jgi:hypothetical protein
MFFFWLFFLSFWLPSVAMTTWLGMPHALYYIPPPFYKTFLSEMTFNNFSLFCCAVRTYCTLHPQETGAVNQGDGRR